MIDQICHFVWLGKLWSLSIGMVVVNHVQRRKKMICINGLLNWLVGISHGPSLHAVAYNYNYNTVHYSIVVAFTAPPAVRENKMLRLD